MSDVAREVGVSSATVSLVLNGGNSTSRVSEATRRRIQAAANKLDYRANAVARSLARRRTDIIGFYCGYGTVDVRSPHLAEIIKGIQDRCDILRNDLLLHGGFRLRTAEGVYRELANGKIDALVLFTPPDDGLVELLAASSLPAVVVVDTVPTLPSVVVDDVAGGRLLAAHLAEKGHSRILYRLGGEHHGVSVRRRLAAFREAAGTYGMTVHEIIEGEWGGAVGRHEADLLSSPVGVRPTAAVCWHDQSAYGLVEWCEAAGVRVPEDLAVLGFNGIQTDASRFCKLTTIRAPWGDVGQIAVSLLMDLIAGKEVAPETVVPVELIAGNTT